MGRMGSHLNRGDSFRKRDRVLEKRASSESVASSGPEEGDIYMCIPCIHKCICMYTYICIYIYIYTHIHTYTYTYTYIYIYIYVHTYIHTYVCIRIYLYIHTHVCMYVCIYIYSSHNSWYIISCMMVNVCMIITVIASFIIIVTVSSMERYFRCLLYVGEYLYMFVWYSCLCACRSVSACEPRVYACSGVQP